MCSKFADEYLHSSRRSQECVCTCIVSIGVCNVRTALCWCVHGHVQVFDHVNRIMSEEMAKPLYMLREAPAPLHLFADVEHCAEMLLTFTQGQHLKRAVRARSCVCCGCPPSSSCHSHAATVAGVGSLMAQCVGGGKLHTWMDTLNACS